MIAVRLICRLAGLKSQLPAHSATHGRMLAALCLATLCMALPQGARAQVHADAICATTSDPASCQQMINSAVGQTGQSSGQSMIQQLMQAGQSPSAVPGTSTGPQPSVVVTPTQPFNPMRDERSKLEEIYSRRAGSTLHQFGYSIIGNGGSVSALQIGAVQDQYILGQGDEIIVTMRGQENSTYNVYVDRDGNITLPKLRPVSALGRRFGDFRRDLDEAIHAGYIQTQDYITIGQVRQVSINVVGEVVSPGVYALSGLSTVLDAVNVAGGVKKTGSLRNIMVVRDGHSIRIDLYRFLSVDGHAEDTTLRQGDRIVVAPIGATVAIAGEVRRPGIYELDLGSRQISVNALLAMANGYTIRGTYRLTTLRTLSDGKLEYVDSTGHGSAPVHDGEILNVTSAVNLIVGHVTLMGNVREPGDYAVDKVRTLHDLLPSAEAFLPLTYTPFAFVMREDKGTLQRHVIPFSIRQLIEGKFNIDLQSDDVVHVLTFASMRQLLALSVAAENAEGATFAGPDASTAAAAGQVAQCVSAQERLQSLPSPDRARSLSAMARRACQPSQAAPATAPNLLQSLTSVGQQTATAGNQTSANGQQTSVTAPAAGQPGLASATTASASSANAPATSSGETSGADAANATGVDAATVAGLTADEQASVGFVLGDYRVTLEGGIREVGDYLAAPGVSLEEMVDAANGLMPDADLNAVEITSVSIDNVEGRSTASRKLYALTPEKLASVPLNRLDVVQIPRVPSNQEQGSVIIDGEVQFPGTYHILKGERLSSLLQRAGGLTRDAYPFGAVFQRPSVARVQQSAHDREADDLQKQLVASVAQNGGPLGGSSGSAFGLTPEATNFLEDVIGQLRDKRVDGRISIVADPVALAADPEADIEVQPGDKLFVPKHPSEVIVTGEVLNPGSYRFSPKLGATDYISMSGGYDRYADEDHMFVINPDGTSHSVSDGMFSISDDRMAPGSVVVVPRDLKPLDLGTLTVMVSKVLSDFAISAASLAVVVHNNN